MYILSLILAIVAVILSPIAIDWYLNLREAQQDRKVYQARQKKGPHLVWATSPKSEYEIARHKEPLTVVSR
jgi:hypothetical protein